MFKKETKDNLDLTKCKPTTTVPFEVVYENQNPEKLKRVTQSVSTPDNIIGILEKNKTRNMNSRSNPQTKDNHEEDIPEYRPSVILARAIMSYNNERRTIRDKETGEIINTRNMNSNRSLSSVVYNSDFLEIVNQEHLERIRRRLRTLDENN